MNSPLDFHLGKQAFLLWAEGREGHFELKGNRIAMMTGGSRNHAFVIQEIAYAIRRQIDPKLWRIASADLAVEIGEDIRYPDIVVEPAGHDGSALSTATPVFVAEVLSPSSLALDLNIKAAEYMSLPSLEAYLVAAQDEMRMWLWQRPASGQPFPKHPQELAGPQARLALAGLALDIAIAEIYAGLVQAAPQPKTPHPPKP